VRVEGSVLFVEISAPPVNLEGPELVRDLVSLIQQAEADIAVKVIVFKSADPDYFISHVDVTKIKENRAAAGMKYVAPIQKRTGSSRAFEYDTWGGEIRDEFKPQPGEIVIQEHWCSSGFANTDLDLQLKKHGIHQLIVTGLIAHTCVEATVRFAAELGYEVTMVKDATTDYSDVEMRAALEVNIPNYASAVVTTDEILEAISSL
jgi:nicotinamidase-related amidase